MGEAPSAVATEGSLPLPTQAQEEAMAPPVSSHLNSARRGGRQVIRHSSRASSQGAAGRREAAAVVAAAAASSSTSAAAATGSVRERVWRMGGWEEGLADALAVLGRSASGATAGELAIGRRVQVVSALQLCVEWEEGLHLNLGGRKSASAPAGHTLCLCCLGLLSFAPLHLLGHPHLSCRTQ